MEAYRMQFVIYDFFNQGKIVEVDFDDAGTGYL